MEWHYETEIIASVAFFVIFFDARKKLDWARLHDRVFLICLIFGFFSSIIDIFDSVMGSWTSNEGLLFASRTLYFAFAATPALLWFIYLSAIVEEKDYRRFKKLLVFSLLSYALYLILLICNIGTHWIFYFDSNGAYYHGNFYFLSYLSCGYFTLMFFLLAFLNFRKISNKRMVIGLLVLPFIVWIGMLLELFMPGWLMVGPSYMVSLLVAYLFVQNRNTEQIIGKLSLEASTDPLTGLSNRLLFEQKAGAALSSKAKGDIAFILVDIDNLKTINDTLGHPAGDQAIQRVAQYLKENLGEAAVLARIGGDEFAVLFLNKKKEELAEEARNFLARFAHESIDGEKGASLPLHCSIGITLRNEGEESKDLKVLYHQADVALYSIKRSSKFSYAFYEPELEDVYRNPQISR
jgi:diguanylate cyclase (GGDEF)-like protein